MFSNVLSTDNCEPLHVLATSYGFHYFIRYKFDDWRGCNYILLLTTVVAFINFNRIQLLYRTLDLNPSPFRRQPNSSCANNVISPMNRLLNCSKFPPLSRHIVFMNGNNVSFPDHSRLWYLLSKMMLTKFRKILPSPTVSEVFKNQIEMLLPFRQLCGCGTWNRILGLWKGTKQSSPNA